MKRAEREAREEVIRSAVRWWNSKRPLSFNDCCHLHQPTINTKTPQERTLADAVADMIRAQEQRP